MHILFNRKKEAALKAASFVMSFILVAVLLISNIFSIPKVDAATSKFTFNGSMTEDVLRAYMSRAVTHQELCGGASYVNPIIEEDIRMLLRTGTKFVGRAAMFSWTGTSKAAIDNHFSDAAEKAKMVHQADPEIILQAGIFEIVREAYVKDIAIPSWVFEAFGQKVETRNFNFSKIAEGKTNFWGEEGAGLPMIRNIEAQMWFYYWGCRYIDIGFEGIHLGQAELMAENKKNHYKHWETVTNKLREYAKKKARRGIVIIDAHSSISSEGMKVGNRLILDVQGAGIVPAETVKENGTLKCKIGHYRDSDCDYQWIGRSGGGIHPLGFTIEANITILEFDNHGNSGKKGNITRNGHYCWGYDDITWFAMQPEAYRNEFLLYCDNYLKTTEKILDSKGRQVYFLQPAMRRVLTPYAPDFPETVYKPGKHFNGDFMLDYLAADETAWNHGKVNNLKTLDDGNYAIENKLIYRANRNGDGCPNGFNQEDTIRQIFLGKNAPENPEYTRVVLPASYGGGQNVSETTSTSNNTAGTISTKSSETALESEGTNLVSGDNTNSDSSFTSQLGPSQSSDSSKKKQNPLPFIIIPTLVILGGAAAFYFLYYKKRAEENQINIGNVEDVDMPNALSEKDDVLDKED